MTVKVKTVAGGEAANLEKLLNDALAKPEYAGFTVAAAFMSPDGSTIVIVLQKP